MGSMTSEEPSLPYWQVNVPEPLRTPLCPAFLSSLNQKDHRIISTPDSEYHTLTWPEVRSIIAQNRLDLFQRRPSDLRRYLENNYHLRQRYGSVMNFVLTHRLAWTQPIVPTSSTAFAEDTDVKVLWNDWPYGIDDRIVHLVVWTKFVLDDGDDGDLTPEMREKVEGYVRTKFCDVEKGGLERDKVIWFKNWASLKSIHAVEHFHVMLFDPEPGLIEAVTGGDVPLFKRAKGWEREIEKA